MTFNTDQILSEKGDGVARLTLNQPEKHNAISYDMWQGISAALQAFDADDDVRVVVVQGAGSKAFSAGADISQFEEKRGSEEAIADYNATARRAYEALRDTPKPTIALIRGFCLGGGAGLALCCDLRFASEDSRFGIPAARLGLAYKWDDVNALTQLVGPSRAKEILFTGRHFTAAEAEQMGLVNRTMPRPVLQAYVDDYAATIAGNAPLTLRAVKETVTQTQKSPDERDFARMNEYIEACYASEDYVEGRRAFMEKRKPRFKGR